MILIPAIDLYEKKAVRLYKGRYDEMTVYSEDPAALAKEIESLGQQVVTTDGEYKGYRYCLHAL